jgi:hypothetical protein
MSVTTIPLYFEQVLECRRDGKLVPIRPKPIGPIFLFAIVMDIA